MKRRFIVTTAFTACLALCAAVWPQTEKVGKTPAPSETAAVTAPQPTLQGAEKPVLPVVTEKKENVERYHAMVKMMVAIERQNLLQIAEDKNLLNNDADLDSFIDGLETALIISMLVEDDTNEFMRSGETPQGIRKFTLGGE